VQLHKNISARGYRQPPRKLTNEVSIEISSFVLRFTNHHFLFPRKHCFFVTHLAQSNLSYAMILVYLSAVRYNYITVSASTNVDNIITPRLCYVLKGIKKTCALTHQPRERLPITFSIMEHLYTVFSKYPNNYKHGMIWAAFCRAYFGLLRVSDFITVSPDFFNQSTD